MRLTFGAIVAVALLALYVYAVLVGTEIVQCSSTPACTAAKVADFTDGMALALTTIGGLVSALVIAELSITEPGKPPVERALAEDASARAKAAVKLVTFSYLLVWIATGLWAFIVGVMLHPKVLQPLTDLGQAWLGLAVAAGYAYFGVKPKG